MNHLLWTWCRCCIGNGTGVSMGWLALILLLMKVLVFALPTLVSLFLVFLAFTKCRFEMLITLGCNFLDEETHDSQIYDSPRSLSVFFRPAPLSVSFLSFRLSFFNFFSCLLSFVRSFFLSFFLYFDNVRQDMVLLQSFR